MSLKSLEARKLATAGVFALAVLGAAASSAQADIEKNLEYGCKYPLVDKKPLSINVKSNIPTYAKINEQQPAFVVNAIATAKDGTSEAIETLDAYKLTGVSEARASLVFPSGFVQGNLKVPLTVDPYIRTPNTPVPDPLVLTANGKTPSVNLDELGKTQVRLDKISLNLAAFYDDGSPINVKKLLTDYDGNAVVDSDGNVNTFDVYCKLNADQDPVIATICVNATGTAAGGNCGTVTPNTPPTKVTGLKVDSKTSSSANLSWAASTDADAGDTVSYKIYRGGALVDTVTGTSYAAGGLTAATAYTFDVEATDGKDAAAKTSVSVTTDPGTVVDTIAPSVPGAGVYNVDTDIGETELTVRWGTSTDTGGSGLKGYNVEYETETGTDVAFVPAGTTFKKFTGLGADSGYYFWISAVDNAGNESAQSEEFLVTQLPNKAPTAPTGLSGGTPTQTAITLTWAASTDPDAGDTIKGYNVYRNGTKVNTTLLTARTLANSGLTADTEYTFEVEAVDSRDKVGPKSAALKVKTAKPIVTNAAPTAPTGVKTTAVLYNSVALSWTASSDDVKVVGYNVYRDGVKIGNTTTGTTYTDATAAEKKTYSYVIEAYDAEPKSTKSAALSVTTPAAPIVDGCPRGLACYNYAAKGSTTLKTLVKGSLPLTGDIKAQLDIATGDFTADLTLNNTSGRLTAAGFLPITAKVGFVPVGKTIGKLNDATATAPQSIQTNSKVRIKVLQVSLFGAIPLAGGNSCQTKSLSDINLKSTNAFDPLKGGTIGGTYTISDLNGCGILNGLVSPLTAGGGNTITLALTKY